MRNFFSCKVLPALALLLFAANVAMAVEEHGMIAVEDYYFKDSTSVYSQHILNTRLRLDVTKLNDSGTLAFHFDGRERNNLGSKYYNSAQKNERIDILNFDYTGEKLYLAAGRLWPKDLPIEVVDGINVFYQNSKELGFGFFGGAKPDPFTQAFNGSFTTAGAYTTYRSEALSSSLAYAHNGYKGGTDRQYVYGQATVNPSRQVTVFATATGDINPKKNNIRLTNGIVDLTWRPDYTKSLTIGYYQFRAFKLFRSMAFNIDDSRQHTYYAGGNYRLLERVNLYARVERQYRNYQSITQEFKSATTYRAGVNVNNIMDTGVNMDTNVAVTQGFGSKHNTYYAEFNRMNWEVLQLVVSGTYMQNQYTYTNDIDNIWLAGVSGNLYLYRSLSLSLSYDREQGRHYTTDRISTRLSLKF